MSLLWRTAIEAEPSHISHADLAGMYSGDWDVSIPRTMREMQQNWDDGNCDHEGELAHGGPRPYVEHLKEDIATNGIREPLTIRGGNVVKDGNHRAIALYEMKHPRIPVRHVR